jgi:hypothetical protein
MKKSEPQMLKNRYSMPVKTPYEIDEGIALSMFGKRITVNGNSLRLSKTSMISRGEADEKIYIPRKLRSPLIKVVSLNVRKDG